MENIMEDKTKWSEVAHHYHGISAFDEYGNFYTDCSFGYGDADFDRKAKNLRMYFPAHMSRKLIPVLRHRDDMTDAEARELATLLNVDWGNSPVFMRFDTPLRWFWHWKNNCLNRYEPRILRWFYTNGFDMDGLIESGQAIRKE